MSQKFHFIKDERKEVAVNHQQKMFGIQEDWDTVVEQEGASKSFGSRPSFWVSFHDRPQSLSLTLSFIFRCFSCHQQVHALDGRPNRHCTTWIRNDGTRIFRLSDLQQLSCFGSLPSTRLSFSHLSSLISHLSSFISHLSSF